MVAGLLGSSGVAPRQAQPRPPEEVVTYESSGTTVHAIQFEPSGPARAGVVILHGAGGLQREFVGLSALAGRLAAAGYAGLVPNYFEAGADDGVRRPQRMERWRRAASDAVEVLRSRRLRVGLWGVSLGGYVAVDTALGQGCEAESAVGVVTGTDVYPPRSPRHRRPVLLVYGQRDDHVRPSSTLAWADQLREAQVPTTVRRISEAGHVFDQKQWTEMMDLVVTHFNETLPEMQA